MTNVELNELLKTAKDSQADWDLWKRDGVYDRSPEWKELYRSVVNAWTILHKAILKSAPCNFHLENGESRNIGTPGLLTDDLMLYYSESVDAQSTMQGTNLKFVTRIERGDT